MALVARPVLLRWCSARTTRAIVLAMLLLLLVVSFGVDERDSATLVAREAWMGLTVRSIVCRWARATRVGRRVEGVRIGLWRLGGDLLSHVVRLCMAVW